MVIVIETLEDGTKLVLKAGEFKLNRVYRLTNGFYRGQLVLLDWISYTVNIMTAGRRVRGASGKLLSKNLVINFTIEDLETVGAELERDRVRKAAQKLLLAGHKEQALKLLKTLKK